MPLFTQSANARVFPNAEQLDLVPIEYAVFA